jgi:hypothetical protein
MDVASRKRSTRQLRKSNVRVSQGLRRQTKLRHDQLPGRVEVAWTANDVDGRGRLASKGKISRRRRRSLLRRSDHYRLVALRSVVSSRIGWTKTKAGCGCCLTCPESQQRPRVPNRTRSESIPVAATRPHSKQGRAYSRRLRRCGPATSSHTSPAKSSFGATPIPTKRRRPRPDSPFGSYVRPSTPWTTMDANTPRSSLTQHFDDCLTSLDNDNTDHVSFYDPGRVSNCAEQSPFEYRRDS